MTAKRPDGGFTLVELLTVIVVLGLLAALAIPTFLNQREKALRAAMVADLRSLVTAQASRAVDGNPMYTDSIVELRDQGYSTSDGISTATIELFHDGSPQYVACVTHEAVDEWLVYSTVTGARAYSPTQCAAPA